MPAERALRADAYRNRQRILRAAEEVFAEQGPGGSTEDVAARAGVAIGTVFRHFPTKDDLLRATMKDLLSRLGTEVAALAADDDPDALERFFTHLVEQAASKRTLVLLLEVGDPKLSVDESLQALAPGLDTLLGRAQQAGAVRDDVDLTEVMALLGGACQGALRAGWDHGLRRRIVGIIFDGLRPVR